jgi:hypothetical protein
MKTWILSVGNSINADEPVSSRSLSHLEREEGAGWGLLVISLVEVVLLQEVRKCRFRRANILCVERWNKATLLSQIRPIDVTLEGGNKN